MNMAEVKEVEKLHRDCDTHDAAHCDINEHHNLDPEFDDCGHTVKEGPGVGMPKGGGHPVNGVIEAYTTPKANRDQDATHGPGVK